MELCFLYNCVLDCEGTPVLELILSCLTLTLLAFAQDKSVDEWRGLQTSGQMQFATTVCSFHPSEYFRNLIYP